MNRRADESEIRGSVQDPEHTLRRLAIGDDAYIEGIVSRAGRTCSGLDLKTQSLVRLGALIAVDAAPPSYLDAVDSARDAGTDDVELVGCLLAVLPALGAARVISAAPKLGLALGYDVVAALEESGSPLP
jgi:4-carboxymuconolactone decarboxylase